jgi:hypothetical protein
MEKNRISQLEKYFQERLLNQNKLIKIKLNSIDKLQNLKTISHFNSHNSQSKTKSIRTNNKYNFTIARPNTASNMPRRIFEYTRNDKKYKYNYNNPELKNDLKRFTNNSMTFRIFNELNKPYHPYSVNTIKNSILFQNKKRKEIKDKMLHINSLKTLLYNNKGISYMKNKSEKFYKKNYNNEYFSKKKLSKIFEEINKNELNNILKYNNAKKDLELRDEIDVTFFEDDKLKKIIKKSLLNDINQDEINNKLYFDFLKPIVHQINYYNDIYRVPHISNNLALGKPIKNLDIFQNLIKNRNILHEKVSLAMNKMFIIKEKLREKKELKRKKMFERGDSKLKKKWIQSDESFELKCYEFEKKFQYFELTDYFWKCNNYSVIDLACKKLKDVIFTKSF